VRSRGLLGTLLAGVAACGTACAAENADVANTNPVHLVRPPVAPLSAMALVGKQIFFDSTLSASGRMACASCHSPEQAYAAPHNRPLQLLGSLGGAKAIRAVPSLRYVDRTPNFSIGPESGEAENVNIPQMAAQAAGTKRAKKLAGSSSAAAMVPQGGLFWDGRVNTLQDQAMGPLFNPAEMANRDVAAVSAKLEQAPYAAQLAQLIGAGSLHAPANLVDEAMFAVARFEIEDSSFHPYTSKYDLYLEGAARLTQAEFRGLKVFEDKARGNCAGCHLDQPGPDGRPPAFTDYQYEALGVPRNDSLATNRNPHESDLGLCGPIRTDLTNQTQYCGMFRTPSLRNVATRNVFFHNGVYRTLQQVVDFYNLRDARPELIYPMGPGRKIRKFDDLPHIYWKNVDIADPPLTRRMGAPAAMSDSAVSDLLAFLGTLTDGYRGGQDREVRPPSP
jgi:cytochrome c peroxidase